MHITLDQIAVGVYSMLNLIITLSASMRCTGRLPLNVVKSFASVYSKILVSESTGAAAIVCSSIKHMPV